MPTILFCSQAAHTGGGVEVWLDELSAALEDLGWTVVVGMARGRFHDPDRYVARHPFRTWYELDGSTGLREDRILALLRLFKKVKPDIIVPVNLSDTLYAASSWKTRGGTARIVTCTHGQDMTHLNSIRDCAPFIDLAVSVSKRMTTPLSEILGDPARVVHIPTGVPAPLERPKLRTELRELVYVGRLDNQEKRIFDLIDLVRLLHDDDVRFHIVGKGVDEEALRIALASETSHERVIFYGHLSRQELYKRIYPRMDALLLFSESEGGPIVAWEAMRHGIVPVVSDFVGRAEEGVIVHDMNGLVFPVGSVNDAAALITARAHEAIFSLSRTASEISADYCGDEFGRRWDSYLRSALQKTARCCETSSQLRTLRSPGRIASLGLSTIATSLIRRILHQRFTHTEAGSEWPH